MNPPGTKPHCMSQLRERENSMERKGMRHISALFSSARSKLMPHAAILPLIVLHLAFMQPLAALQQHLAEHSQHPLSTHPHLALCNPSTNRGSPTHGPLPWFCTSAASADVHAVPLSRRAGPATTVSPKHSVTVEGEGPKAEHIAPDVGISMYTSPQSNIKSSPKQSADYESLSSMEHEAEAPDLKLLNVSTQGSLNASLQSFYFPFSSQWAFPYDTPALESPCWEGDCRSTTGWHVDGDWFMALPSRPSSISGLVGWRYPSQTFPSSWGGIQALRVEFFDGTERIIGTIPDKHDYDHRASGISFQPDETIDGDITVRTASGYWGYHTHVSYIHFRTNMGQTFEVGHCLGERYDFNADGRSLTGLFGVASWNVDQIGFLVDKDISSMVLEDVEYVGLSDLGRSVVKAQTRGEERVCTQPDKVGVDGESSSSASTETLFKQFKEGAEHHWTIDENIVPPFLHFRGHYVMHAGVPRIVQSKHGRSEWVVGPEASHSATERSFQNVTETFDVICPPARTIIGDQVQHWARYKQPVLNISNLAYTATAQFEFSDGSRWSVPVQGRYSGTVLAKGEFVLESRYSTLLVVTFFGAVEIALLCGLYFAYKRYLRQGGQKERV